MNKFFIMMMFVCGMLIISYECKHASTEELVPAPIFQMDTTNHSKDTVSHLPNTGDSVCFNTQIFPLIISNCALKLCHDAITKKKGYDFTSYLNIARYGYPIYNSVLNNKMPQGIPPLTLAQKAMFLKWINEGSHNVKCDTSTCDTSNVTYTSSIQPIIQTYCIGCHSITSTGGGVLLNSYSDVKTNLQNGHLMCSIQWTGTCYKMPQTGGQLSVCNIRKFTVWSVKGFPQ